VYLLDSNVCIRLLNQRDHRIEQQFRNHAPSEIALCSVVKAELLYGARHSQRVESNLHRLELFFSPLASFSFDDSCTEIYAHIRHRLTVHGQLIGPNDLLVAAIAIANNAVLVTHNQREFARISGLQLCDWEID